MHKMDLQLDWTIEAAALIPMYEGFMRMINHLWEIVSSWSHYLFQEQSSYKIIFVILSLTQSVNPLVSCVLDCLYLFLTHFFCSSFLRSLFLISLSLLFIVSVFSLSLSFSLSLCQSFSFCIQFNCLASIDSLSLIFMKLKQVMQLFDVNWAQINTLSERI